MIVFRCNEYRIPPDYSREKFILHTFAVAVALPRYDMKYMYLPSRLHTGLRSSAA